MIPQSAITTTPGALKAAARIRALNAASPTAAVEAAAKIAQMQFATGSPTTVGLIRAAVAASPVASRFTS